MLVPIVLEFQNFMVAIPVWREGGRDGGRAQRWTRWSGIKGGVSAKIECLTSRALLTSLRFLDFWTGLVTPEDVAAVGVRFLSESQAWINAESHMLKS